MTAKQILGGFVAQLSGHPATFISRTRQRMAALVGAVPQPTGAIPWEFPTFVNWLAVPLVVLGLWLLLLGEHIVYLENDSEKWEIRFQALYLRIVFVFPVLATLAYLGTLYPWLTHWLDLPAVALEVYVLFGFFAFLTGLAHVKSAPGVFPDCLLQSKWTNRRTLWGGSPFQTGQGAQNYFFYSVMQFMIVKPAILLAIAIYYNKSGHDLPQRLQVPLNLVSSLSIIIATIAVLRVYKGLISLPNSVLIGHRAILKIAVVKLLFVFIVLNSVVLRNLADNDFLPVPPRLCSATVKDASETNRDLCEIRTINVIMMLETMICIIPAIFSYRHHGLGLTVKWHMRYPLCKFITLIFLKPFDLPMFWNGRLPKVIVVEQQNDQDSIVRTKDLESQQTVNPGF